MPVQTADHSDTRGGQGCDPYANGHSKRRSRWRPWAELPKRSYDIDLRCPRCRRAERTRLRLWKQTLEQHDTQQHLAANVILRAVLDLHRPQT